MVPVRGGCRLSVSAPVGHFLSFPAPFFFVLFGADRSGERREGERERGEGVSGEVLKSWCVCGVKNDDNWGV